MKFKVESKSQIKSKPDKAVKARKFVSIAKYAIERTRIRTMKGLDIDLKSFKAYSKAYSKKKRSSRVNLNATGAMLGSIRYDIENNEIVLYSNDEVAYKHQNGIGTPKREWLGIDKVTAKKIDELLLDAYEPEL